MANQDLGRASLRQSGWTGALVAPVAVVLLFLSACGTGVDAGSSSSPAALVESQTLTVSVPQGTSLQELAVLGSDSVRLAPKVQVVPASGSVAHVASLGGTNVGVEASIRDLFSQGQVFLGERARVDGFIKTTTPPVRQDSVVITGPVDAAATLVPPTVLSVSIDFPGGSDVNLEPSQSRTLAPGAYGRVSVKPRATLSLSAGNYHLTSLSVEPRATLKLDTSQGPVIVYTQLDLSWKGKVSYTGDDSSFLMAQLGSSMVSLESPFTGSVVAPNATLRLAPVASPGFRGSFIGKRVEVEPRNAVTFDAFEHWGAVFPPVPFVNCVSQVARGQYVALFGYRNALKVSVTVAEGPSNLLTPTPTPNTSPPTVFAPGEHPVALWAPLSNGSLTWKLGASSATATSSSPRCGPDAYPDPEPSPPDMPRGEHPSPPLSLTQKPASYFSAPPDPPAPPPPAPTSNSGTRRAAARVFVPPPNFVVRIVGGRTGEDGTFASQDLDAKVTINGENAGTKDIYSNGCVFGVDACPFGEPFTTNVEFSRPVAPRVATVEVRIELFEVDDASDNERVGDLTFTVDNTNGTFMGQAKVDGDDSWEVFFEVEHTGLPAVSEPLLCAALNAAFVDEGFGEDFVGTPVAGQNYQSYPAAFMSFSLSVEGPLNEGTLAGNLDENGCVPLGTIPADAYAFQAAADPTKPEEGALNLRLTVDMRIIKRPDGVRYDLFTRFGIPALETHFSVRPGDVALSTWTKTGAWMTPPARIDLPGLMLNPMTNNAVAIAGLLSRTDMAIPVDDPETTDVDEGFYQVEYGDGCHFIDDTGNEFIDSCFFDDTLWVGPATRPSNSLNCSVDTDCPTVQLCFDQAGTGACNGGTGCKCLWPDQSRWKYVTAHEAGHQVQARALGNLGSGSYVFGCPANTTCTGRSSGDPRNPNLLADPPFIDSMSPLCGCQHVEAANRLHCLQSIERFDNAHSEGFGQFFASKTWNATAGGGCKFVYYKEFLDTECRDGNTCIPFSVGPNSPPLQSNIPPLAIDCEEPVKWRNAHCPMSEAAELATELDWLGFLWALNTSGDATTSMADLFSIHRNACNPMPEPGPGEPGPRCQGETLAWSARPPVPVDPRVVCSAAVRQCPTDYVCLNDATWKSCETGDVCSCQTAPVYGFVQGAELFYADDGERRRHVRAMGLRYGVTEDLAP